MNILPHDLPEDKGDTIVTEKVIVTRKPTFVDN